MKTALIRCLVAAAALALPAPAAALTNAQISGLQVALREHGLYAGPIDGVAGPATRRGVLRFQKRTGLTVDGIAGIQTRTALGPLGRPLYGRRTLVVGKRGWDVSVLQFLLVSKGFRFLPVDGHFGPRTARAVRAFQRQGGLVVDGVAGPQTLRALAGRGLAAPQGSSSSSQTYLVRAGDTLTGIAGRFGISLEALARANRLDPARVLLAGRRLRVPAFRPARAARTMAMESSWTVRAALDHWAGRYGVDASLVRALAWMESGFQQHIVSSAGAEGVMQVTPATWDFVETVLLGRDVPHTLDGNVRVGVAFLDHLLHEFDGDERLALAAYYQGPLAVRQRGILPETRHYVADVLALKSRV